MATKERENKKSFLNRLYGFSIGPVVNAGIGFLLVPIESWLVAPKELGKAAMYTIAVQVASLFLNLGFDQSYIREYSTEKDKSALLWNSFIIPFSFSVLGMFGILIFGEDLSVLLFGEKADYIIKMLAFSLPLLVILRFNTVIVRMEEKAKLYSYMQIMQRCLYFFFLVLVMYLLKVSDFKGIVQSYFLSVASTAVVTTIITMKHWFVRFKIDKDLLKKLLFYGLPLIPTAIMVWLQNSMASISLRLWGDFRDIGIYSAALKIANIVTVIQTSFSTFWSPTAFKWFENKEPISKFEKVSFKLNSILSVIFAGVVLFRKPIIGFLSPEYSSASQLVPFLLFAPVMYTLAETTKMGINLVRKTQYYIVILSVTCAVNILGCFILVPQFGALGAAISTALSFVVNFLLSTFLSRKLWRKISVSRHLISIFLMLMMAFLAVVYDNLFIDLFLFVIIIGIYFRDIVWGIQLMLEFLGQILHRKFKNRG